MTGSAHLCRLVVAAAMLFGAFAPGLAFAEEPAQPTAPEQVPPGPAAQEAEKSEKCNILRVHPAGLLTHCGSLIRSFAIEFDEMRRQIRNDMNGVFHFICPLEEMCAGEPQVSGWMIDHVRWWNSPHDEAAIFELLARPPVILGGMARPMESAGERPKSTCGIMELEIAGLPAQAVCYDFEERKSATIVAVASGAEIGFLLLFNQHDVGSATLREKFRDLAPRFKLERASGDAVLMRWLR